MCTGTGVAPATCQMGRVGFKGRDMVTGAAPPRHARGLLLVPHRRGYPLQLHRRPTEQHGRAGGWEEFGDGRGVRGFRRKRRPPAIRGPTTLAMGSAPWRFPGDMWEGKHCTVLLPVVPPNTYSSPADRWKTCNYPTEGTRLLKRGEARRKGGGRYKIGER